MDKDPNIYISDPYLKTRLQLANIRSENLFCARSGKVCHNDKHVKELMLVIATTDTLAAIIGYRKLKEGSEEEADSSMPFLDLTMSGFSLQNFFGNNELPEMERQLKNLQKDIMDTAKILKFDWQCLL